MPPLHRPCYFLVRHRGRYVIVLKWLRDCGHGRLSRRLARELAARLRRRGRGIWCLAKSWQVTQVFLENFE